MQAAFSFQPQSEPFVAALEALLQTRPELLSEIDKQLCDKVYETPTSMRTNYG